MDRSPSKSCNGPGVALKVHQNEPKCTNIHPKGHHCKTDQKVSNLPSVTNMALHMRCTKTRDCYREGPNNTIHFQKRWCILVQLMHYPMTHNLLRLLSPFKCLFNPETDNIFHSGQFLNTLLSLAMVSILVHFGALWCILVHLMCHPFMTCLDSYTLPDVHLIQKWIISVT